MQVKSAPRELLAGDPMCAPAASAISEALVILIRRLLGSGAWSAHVSAKICSTLDQASSWHTTKSMSASCRQSEHGGRKYTESVSVSMDSCGWCISKGMKADTPLWLESLYMECMANSCSGGLSQQCVQCSAVESVPPAVSEEDLCEGKEEESKSCEKEAVSSADILGVASKTDLEEPAADTQEKPTETEEAPKASSREILKLSKSGRSSESKDSEFWQQHMDDLDWLCTVRTSASPESRLGKVGPASKGVEEEAASSACWEGRGAEAWSPCLWAPA